MAIYESKKYPGVFISDNNIVFKVTILTPYDNGNGYKKVSVRDKFGTRKQDYVHRIAVEASGGKIPPGKEVHHKDSNPSNNKLNNLEVITKLSNLEKRNRGMFNKKNKSKSKAKKKGR